MDSLVRCHTISGQAWEANVPKISLNASLPS